MELTGRVILVEESSYNSVDEKPQYKTQIVFPNGSYLSIKTDTPKYTINQHVTITIKE